MEPRAMIDSAEVKNILFSLGAELCGITGMDRLEAAPEGFHPRNVMPDCQSAIIFACRFPVGALHCVSHAPYTRIRNSITAKMDAIALDACIELDKRGISCAPIPTNEAIYDTKTGRSRCIVSLKHLAQAAGLGTIGRHSLLITPELGSMLWLGGILCEAELEADDLKEAVCNQCGLCVKACPIGALADPQMNQQACWEYAFGEDPENKSWRIHCHKCRDICPYNLGTKNAFRRSR